MSQQNYNIVIQETLQVKHKHLITPNYMRLTLTCKNLYKFKQVIPGSFAKIFIPPNGLNEIHFPQLDEKQMKWIYPPEDVKPFIRTYTFCGINMEKDELYLEFVLHGENGTASRWATHCDKGDLLGILMHDGIKELCPIKSFYLLVGDGTAIPVLSAILKNLSSEAKGFCLIEVFSEADKQVLETKAPIEFIWLYNQHPDKGSELAENVMKLSLPTQNRFAYIASEFTTVKTLRNFFRKEIKWNREEIYAFSYWKIGHTEESSETERNTESESI